MSELTRFILANLILWVAYTGIYFLFSVLLTYFFEERLGRINKRSALRSLGLIFLLTFIGYVIVFLLPDAVLANRFQHGFCGGFLAFLLCYLVVKDSELAITKFQLLVIGGLAVTALGVANELMEFTLQYYTPLVFSKSINDTWLDLVSNTTGLLLAAALLVPRFKSLK